MTEPVTHNEPLRPGDRAEINALKERVADLEEREAKLAEAIAAERDLWDAIAKNEDKGNPLERATARALARLCGHIIARMNGRVIEYDPAQHRTVFRGQGKT